MNKIILIFIVSLFLNLNLNAKEKYTRKELWRLESQASRMRKRFPEQSIEWKYYYMLERATSKGWTFFNQGLFNLSINMEKIEQLNEPISSDDLQEIAFKLMHHPMLPIGIIINPEKIERQKVRSGVCTALSLNFLNIYFQQESPQNLKEKLYQISMQYRSGATAYVGTSQSVFNALELTEECLEPTCDIRWAKMQTCANLYELYLEPMTDALSLFDGHRILKSISGLTEGVYLIRLLHPLPLQIGEKGEVTGHTIVLIKEAGQYYLYDPNLGTGEISLKMLGAVCGFYKSFLLEEMRIYGVTTLRENRQVR